MASIDVSKYGHSSVHKAIATKDHGSLKKLLGDLPKLCSPNEITTEATSQAEEEKVEAISAVIDRRDVPNRDSPLHLAVKIRDEAAAEMLMVAGADWCLRNEQGWTALQDAICTRQESIAMTIVRHYQPLKWAKWCRRLHRLIGTMHRMRDFYMEINFNFESSVPFISRIAPSDTYKIWKRGANLRADMTLAGFDGFRIEREDQSVLFLGDGSADGKVPAKSFCMISHKKKEVWMNALDGARSQSSEEKIRQKVKAMSQTNICRPGINVSEAILLPQLTWRRQEKVEMVGSWKAKVYDMHNVVVSIKSRRVPGAKTEKASESEEFHDILTEDERKQLEAALKLDETELSSENGPEHRHSCFEQRDAPIEDLSDSVDVKQQEKKGWFSGWRKRESNNKHPELQKKSAPPRNSPCLDDKVSNLLNDDDSSPPRVQKKSEKQSTEIATKRNENRKGRERDSSSNKSSSSSSMSSKDEVRENEYKKGLKPVLWLAPNFPLQIEELLPLLDILANKVKAIRRLRELLTTKLPIGTFPVKVALPVIPAIRVIVTFTKFEELSAPIDEFASSPSSPTSMEGSDQLPSSSSSWFQWIKSSYNRHGDSSSPSNNRMDQDLFMVPLDYKWI